MLKLKILIGNFKSEIFKIKIDTVWTSGKIITCYNYEINYLILTIFFFNFNKVYKYNTD